MTGFELAKTTEQPRVRPRPDRYASPYQNSSSTLGTLHKAPSFLLDPSKEKLVTGVHVKIADSGWILEKCAKELAIFDPRVTVSNNERLDASIQYYLNYSSFRKRISPIEIAFFTHIEENPEARIRFFDVASKMDHCICMADRYAEELRKKGIVNVSVIRPGVDLDKFKPKLRIGVIGRTYNSGRKGEKLVEQVMDVEGIDWFFTGSGWPGPALNVPPGEMSNFYNSLDYVLVPAKYEGGPMSVIEGLACGKQIISSDVGWIQEFPHISFENDNAESLRSVLRSLLAKRYELRSAVQECSWRTWASSHVSLFEQLQARKSVKVLERSVLSTIDTNIDTKNQKSFKVMLATHGNEKKSKGGPSIRVPRTVDSLKAIGVNAFESGSNLARPDLLHLFNVWPSASSNSFIGESVQAGIPSILSPIFLNLTAHKIYSKTIPKIYTSDRGSVLEKSLAEICEDLDNQPNLPVFEPYPGYHEQVRQIVKQADHVILLSEFERRCLDFLGATNSENTSIVHNPVNSDLFDDVDIDLFRKTYGLQTYVLQLGRIESRKNQLLVAEAARRLDIAAVFIGHEGESEYAALLHQIAGPKALFIPRLSQKDPLLASAIAGASVFCLPSWAEGAPLAALEAGAAGIPLVLSDRSGEREYFGKHATYVNPADLPGMIKAIETALEQSDDENARQNRSRHVRTQFNWERHAKETAAVYKKVTAKQLINPLSSKLVPEGRIFFDITDWAHAGEQLTGVSRVQCCQFRSLPAELKERIVPVTWRHGTNEFFIVCSDELQNGSITPYIMKSPPDHSSALTSESIRPSDRFYSSSIAWSGNNGHFEAIMKLKSYYRLPVALLIHDLIRVELSYLYDDVRVKNFSDRLAKFAETVDCLMFYSKATEKVLANFLEEKYLLTLSGAHFPLGDGQLNNINIQPSKPLDSRLGRFPFMLVVGTIEPRKNHLLLLQALKRLKSDFGAKTPYLVIAGKDYIASPALNHWLEKNPEINQLVIRLRDVSDGELSWLYENAFLSLFPSVCEGWGLPVAESFQHGTVCLASNASSIPEAAYGFAVLLDPYDPSAWTEAIAERIRNPEKLKTEQQRILSEWKPQSWEQSVVLALNAVQSFPVRNLHTLETSVDEIRCAQKPDQLDNLISAPLEQTIDLADYDDQRLVRHCFISGFHNPEEGGIWQSKREAQLWFDLTPEKNINRISLQLSALTPRGTKRKILLRINDSKGTIVSLRNRPKTYHFVVPATAISKGRLLISLSMDYLMSPRSLGMNEDGRDLGVFISSINLFQDTGPRQFMHLFKSQRP